MFRTQITMDFKTGQQTMVETHETREAAKRTLAFWQSWPHFVCGMLDQMQWRPIGIYTEPTAEGRAQA